MAEQFHPRRTRRVVRPACVRNDIAQTTADLNVSQSRRTQIEQKQRNEAGFSDAAWGVIEMHRTDLARPLLEVWQQVQPDSSQMELNVGWAYGIDGRRNEAIAHLRRALELDPEDDDAAALLRQLGGNG